MNEAAPTTIAPGLVIGVHRLAVWEPGRRIRFEKKRDPGAILGLVFMIGMALLLLGAVLSTIHDAKGPAWAMVAATAVFLVPVYAVWLAFQPQFVDFDWSRRRLDVNGLTAYQVPLDAIRGLRVNGEVVKDSLAEQENRRRQPDLFSCDILVRYAKGKKEKTGALLSTDGSEQPEPRWAQALPLAEALAAALGVPLVVSRADGNGTD